MYSEQLKTFVMNQINSKIKYIMKKLNFCLFLMLFMSAMVMPATIQAKSIKHKFMRGIILEYDSLPGRATLTCGKTFVMTGHFDKICNTFVTDCKLIAKNFSRVINGTPQEGLTFEGEVAFVELNINGGIFYTITLVSGKLKLGNYELSNIKDTFFKLSRSDWSIYNLERDVEWWENVSSSIDDKFWNSYKFGDNELKLWKFEQLKGGSPKQASLFKHTRFYSEEEINQNRMWGDRLKEMLHVKNEKLRIDYDNGAFIIYNLEEPSDSETIEICGIHYVSLPNGDFYSNSKGKRKFTFTDAIVVDMDTTQIEVPVNTELFNNYIVTVYDPLIVFLKTDSTKFIGNVTINGKRCGIFDIASAYFRNPNTLSTQELGLKFYDGYLLDKNYNEKDIYYHGDNKSDIAIRIAKQKAKEERAIAEEKAVKAERERKAAAVWQSLAKKYGAKWTDMAKQGRVAVGMPEEVLKNIPNVNYWTKQAGVYIRYYWVDNEYDLYYISNGKVSYIAHHYDVSL